VRWVTDRRRGWADLTASIVLRHRTKSFSISDGPRTRLEPVPVAVEEEVSSAFTCTPAHLKTLGESRITTFQNSIRTPTL
jgi:hypothetical protein